MLSPLRNVNNPEERQLDQLDQQQNNLKENGNEGQMPNPANAYFTKKTVISGLMNMGLVSSVGSVW